MKFQRVLLSASVILTVVTPQAIAGNMAPGQPAAVKRLPGPPVLTRGADAKISLRYDQPTPGKTIFEKAGAEAGVDVVFIPTFRPPSVTIEVDADSITEALDAISQATDAFWVAADDHTIIVGEDSPQNRRDLEPLVIRFFPLTYADPHDVDRMLRSLVEARRVSVITDLNAVVVRTSVPKIAVMEDLIRRADQPPGAVDLRVDLFLVRRSPSSTPRPADLAPGGISGFITDHTDEWVGTSSTSVRGPATGRLEVKFTADDLGIGLDLSAGARPLGDTGEVNLDVDARVILAGNAVEKSDQKVTATTTVRDAETTFFCLPDATPGSDLLLAVTPTIRQTMSFPPEDLESMWVGTETHAGP